MFGFKKPKPMVLSLANCNFICGMLSAVEVLCGKKARWKHMDCREGHGEMYIGSDLHHVRFIAARNDLYLFAFGKKVEGVQDDWHTAHFNDNMEVTVAHERNRPVRKTVAGDFEMVWVGSSFADRREAPLFFENAQYCAKVRNMTLEQLLAGEPEPATK